MAQINLPFEGEVTADNKDGFAIRNKGVKGTGVSGQSDKWVGVHGISKTNHSAVWGESKGEGGYGVWGETTHDKGASGVYGISIAADGVKGVSTNAAGVAGSSTNSFGVWGYSTGPKAAIYGESIAADGVKGVSTNAAGVAGSSTNSFGVWGYSTGPKAAIYGESIAADDVKGVSTNAAGVAGSSTNSFGVWGYSTGPKAAIYGESETTYGVNGLSKGFDGIKGETRGALAAGVAGYNYTNKGYGIWGAGGEWAGFFDGNVSVTGELQVTYDIMLRNADCAEEFDIIEENVEAGTVMVLNEMGSLEPSYQEYDKKVAGIISGASGYKPAIVLDSQHSQDQKQENQNKNRLPIALMGKVYCKVDARNSSIEIGDLLTSSSTKGHAMKADNPSKAFGTGYVTMRST